MPLAKRLRLGGVFGGGGGATGGRGLVLGPVPNVFGATAGPPDGTVAPAADRASAEAVRDTQLLSGAASTIKWETGNRVTGSDYFNLQSVDAYTEVPWGTGTAWYVPSGTLINASTNQAYSVARDSSAITLSGGKLRVRAYTYDRPNTTGRTIKEEQIAGDSVTMTTPTGGWAVAYLNDSGLNIRLFYMAGGVEAVTHQVWQSSRWVDNLSVTGLAGKQGLPGPAGSDGADGIGASFAAVAQGNLVTVDAAKQAADTGIAATDVVVDSDLSTVAKTGAYTDLSGVPTVLSTADVQTLVGAMFDNNTETGLTATYNPATQKIDLIVSTGSPVYSTPAFSKVAITGLTTRQESDFNVSGDYTMTWELSNHTNITSDLTIRQLTTTGGSTATSIVKTGVKAAASGSTSFTSVSALLDDVGENVEWRISGTDKQGAGINGAFTVSRVAMAATDTLWWGRLSSSAAFGTIASLTSTTLPGGGSKVVNSNSDVAGDYRFPAGQPNGWIGWFIPTSVGTFKNVFQNNFNVNNTVLLVGTRTIGGVEYAVYRHALEQKGDSNIDFEFRV